MAEILTSRMAWLREEVRRKEWSREEEKERLSEEVRRKEWSREEEKERLGM